MLCVSAGAVVGWQAGAPKGAGNDTDLPGIGNQGRRRVAILETRHGTQHVQGPAKPTGRDEQEPQARPSPFTAALAAPARHSRRGPQAGAGENEHVGAGILPALGPGDACRDHRGLAVRGFPVYNRRKPPVYPGLCDAASGREFRRSGGQPMRPGGEAREFTGLSCSFFSQELKKAWMPDTVLAFPGLLSAQAYAPLRQAMQNASP